MLKIKLNNLFIRGVNVKKTYVKTTLIAIVLVILFTSLLRYPFDVIAASKRGLDIWWGVIFPTLLPFLIVNELLRKYGVVQALGIILDPIMRPLFKVSGHGGYALAIGMTSGMPVGAKVVTQLRLDNLITRTEAERLLTFSNFANPLFIFGAVAIGFYGLPSVGLPLAIAHYAGGIFTGLLMRFYKSGDRPIRVASSGSLFMRAYYSMHKSRISKTLPFGKIFSDAVQSSVQTLLMIGGFIIVFSVINELLSKLLNNNELLAATIAGIIELSLGSKELGASVEHLFLALLIQSFILGFSGLSIHSQILAIISESDIRYFPFFVSKLIHGVVSGTILFFLFRMFDFSKTTSLVVGASFGAQKIGPAFTFIIAVLILGIFLFSILFFEKERNMGRH